jgi:uncharacterized membrane protein YfcA
MGEYSLYSLLPLLLDIDLRELPFDGFYDGGVLRFSAGAGQGIASVSGIFYRIPPGFRKYKIGFREVFPFGVRQLRHFVYPGLSNSSTSIFCRRYAASLFKVALLSKVGQQQENRLWCPNFMAPLPCFGSRQAFPPPSTIRMKTMHFSGLFPLLNWRWLWLTVAAFLAGLLNAVAGGGSFLSFPAMLSMNISPIQANATNTVALWPGQLTSIAAYREDIRKNSQMVLPMALAGLLGGTVGAIVLLNTPQLTFLHMVPWLLLGSALIFAVSGPVSRWLEARKTRAAGQTRAPRRLPLFFATAAVCFYIGYFGAGAGFLIITVLSLFGFQDLHEINALKVVSTTLANGIAVVIFSVSGKVVWPYCLLAMVVCAIGGYSSARLARRVPQPALRGLVVFIGLSMAAFFFWRNP